MRSWRFYLGRWAITSLGFFALAWVLFGLLDPGFPWTKIAIIATGSTGVAVLIEFLAQLGRDSGDPATGLAARDNRLLAFGCLAEAVLGLVMALLLPSWWRLLGASGAVLGLALAYGIWKRHLQVPMRR